MIKRFLDWFFMTLHKFLKNQDEGARNYEGISLGCNHINKFGRKTHSVCMDHNVTYYDTWCEDCGDGYRHTEEGWK